MDERRSHSDKSLHRLIVVSPGKGDSYLEIIYRNSKRTVPSVLTDWEMRVDTWCSEYRGHFGDCSLVEVNLLTAVYIFDRTHERVVISYGIASTPAKARDRNRMRSFPDVKIGVRATMQKEAFAADRGHLLSHAAGGELDINLFPQRRELNRGWSSDGKLFRRMEEYAARRTGTFHFHRPLYDDLTWIPASLEYGVLRDDQDWWIERFHNK